MLRVLIAALLLANLAFYAWTQGWLDSVVGARAIGDREPERLQRQFRPESVRILPADVAAAALAEAASPAPNCFVAGPYTDTELVAAQAAAGATLPPGSWSATKAELPGAWLVYMGRYASREAQLRKEEELKRRNLPYDEVAAPPALAPGLALGRFDQRAAADQALAQLTQQGVKTARVVELEAPSTRTVLRVERADKALAERIAALRPEAMSGKGFTACGKPAGT